VTLNTPVPYMQLITSCNVLNKYPDKSMPMVSLSCLFFMSCLSCVQVRKNKIFFFCERIFLGAGEDNLLSI
jgi:hypothetical protein